MIDFNKVSRRVFQILKSRGYNLKMYQDNGAVAKDPELEARKFFVEKEGLMVSIVNNGENSEIKTYISKNTAIKELNPIIQLLRQTANFFGLLFNVKKYTKTLTPKEFAFLAYKTQQEEKEIAESSDDTIAIRNAAFAEIASMQRGAPEEVMVKIQFANGGGILNPVVERVGDIIHRMTESFEDMKGAREDVLTKINTALRNLKSPYGFEREMNENIQSNAKFKNLDSEQVRTRVDELLKRYAEEFKKIPTYNRAQQMAKDAAISVGYQNWDDAIKFLEGLKRLAEDPNQYIIEVSKFEGKTMNEGKRNPMAKELAKGQYQPKVVPNKEIKDKKKDKWDRKAKHKAKSKETVDEARRPPRFVNGLPHPMDNEFGCREFIDSNTVFNSANFKFKPDPVMSGVWLAVSKADVVALVIYINDFEFEEVDYASAVKKYFPELMESKKYTSSYYEVTYTLGKNNKKQKTKIKGPSKDAARTNFKQKHPKAKIESMDQVKEAVEIVESKDMSNLFGSSKSSYQKIGAPARMIVRHSSPVDEQKHGSRSRNISKIFIENAEGERIKFPVNWIQGARAMTRHISEGGLWSDDIGSYIQQVCEEYRDMKSFAKLSNKSLNEEAGEVINTVKLRINEISSEIKRLQGPTSYKRFSEGFKKSEEALNEDQLAEEIKRLQGLFNLGEETFLESVAKLTSNREKIIELKDKPSIEQKVQELLSQNAIHFIPPKEALPKFPDKRTEILFKIRDLASRAKDDNVSVFLARVVDALDSNQKLTPEEMELTKAIMRASSMKQPMESFVQWTEAFNPFPTAMMRAKLDREKSFKNAPAAELRPDMAAPTPDETEQRILDDYNSGKTIEELCELYGLTPEEIQEILDSVGDVLLGSVEEDISPDDKNIDWQDYWKDLAPEEYMPVPKEEEINVIDPWNEPDLADDLASKPGLKNKIKDDISILDQYLDHDPK